MPIGPVEYLIVAFPGNQFNGEIAPALADLVESGTIRILDLVFITRGEDGSVAGLTIADLDGDGTLDLAVFEGASSGLIDEDDINEAGSVIEPGSSAGILIYENLWAGPFAAALRRSGAELVARGPITPDDMVAAVEAAEARN